jgi:hypothetical protein
VVEDDRWTQHAGARPRDERRRTRP